MTPAEAKATIAAVRESIRDQYITYTTIAATYDKLTYTESQVDLMLAEARRVRAAAAAMIADGDDVELAVACTMLVSAIDAFIAKATVN